MCVYTAGYLLIAVLVTEMEKHVFQLTCCCVSGTMMENYFLNPFTHLHNVVFF